MKKLFATVMLLVYLFNLIGYNLLYRYHIKLADAHIVEKADNDRYSEKDLTEIKIKLNQPYLRDWPSYERFDGEIELNGVNYNYVKRKVSQDTLYLLCVPNDEKTHLLKEKADYASKATESPRERKDNNTNVKKGLLLNEFQDRPTLYDFSVTGRATTYNNSPIINYIADPFISSIGYPPEIQS